MTSFFVILFEFEYLGGEIMESTELGEVLLKATKNNNLTGVITALKSGANVNYRDKNYWNALMYAIFFEFDNIEKVLLDAGAEKPLQHKSDVPNEMLNEKQV